MSWLRWWTGTVNDPKWRMVASRAKCRPGDCVAVWAYLLELAKDGEGDVSRADTEECAVVLGYDHAEVEAIIAAMRDRRLIEGDAIAAWHKRQPKREDDSRERVARHREAKRAEKSVTNQRAEVCNAPVTHGNAPESETDTETEDKQESVALRTLRARAEPEPDPVAIGIRQEIVAAYERRGALPPPTHDVAMWLKRGYSPDLIRSVVIHAVSTRPTPPKTLSYFAGRLAEEHARILAEMARPPPPFAPRPTSAAPGKPGGRGGLIAAMDRMQADAQTDDPGQFEGAFRVVPGGPEGRPEGDGPRLLAGGGGT